MSVAVTYITDSGLDGVTNVSTTSTYARSQLGDDHAILAQTGPDASRVDPIGIIVPRPALEKAEADLASGGKPLALIRTASAQQRTHATEVDDFLAFRIEVLTDIPAPALTVDVINLETGRVTESITMVALEADLFVGGCVMVSTGHALKFRDGGVGVLVTRVTLVLEPTDDPNVFAKMCCCQSGDGEDTTCCTPWIEQSCFFQDQGDFKQINSTYVISWGGIPGPPPNVFRVGADNILAGANPTVEVLQTTCGPAPQGTKPVIAGVIVTPAVPGTSLAALDINFDFTGFDNLDAWLVRIVQPCGCAAVFMLVGGQG